MDFIKTFFQKDAKCNNCQCNFTVSMKRRQCRVCSNVNIDLFFCKQCSQVVRHKYLKIFKSKRYCNTCYNSQTFHKISVSTERPRAKSAFNKKLKNTVKIIKQDPLKHYSLLLKIGEGSIGSVFKAEKISSGTLVALKRIFLSDCFEKSKVINEIGLMQLTLHENIIACKSSYEFKK